MDPITKKQIREQNIAYAISKWTGIPPEKKSTVVEKQEDHKEWVFYYKYKLGQTIWKKVKKMNDGLYDGLLKTYTCIGGNYRDSIFNYEKGLMNIRSTGIEYDLKCEMEMIGESKVDLVTKYKTWFNLSLIDSLQQSMDTKVSGPLDYTETDLDEKSSEYQLLADFFRARSHEDNQYIYEINKIRKINHPVKARKYVFERETADDMTEALLFHGRQ
ncbi:MAG: hypothetical protein PHG66_04920 [Candidatus Colwellbacteria bacterium]|nr:hypothetical protein [Candidatus Colwellbacteria bacterium]